MDSTSYNIIEGVITIIIIIIIINVIIYYYHIHKCSQSPGSSTVTKKTENILL